MVILPAIDLRGGQCVRLKQGDYSQETVFDEDPAAVATRFRDAGAKWLHVVDLDGARAGSPQNVASIERIVAAVGGAMETEVGGGIRRTEDVAGLLDRGVRRIIVGTRAVREPDWLAEIADRWPGRVALGLDARAGRVAVEGWQEATGRMATEVVDMAAHLPVAAIIYTDIAKDGMMAGPNVEATAEMVRVSPFPVIASGGVTTVDDVRRLKQVGVWARSSDTGALYEGTIKLEEAIQVAAE